MKNSRTQIVAVCLLMLAIFIGTEGVLPQIFARTAKKLVMVKEHEGIKFRVVLDKNSFTQKNEVLLKSQYTNLENEKTEAVLGAAVISVNGVSRFTNKDALQETSQTNALAKELLPGKMIEQDFRLWPYYMENGVAKKVTQGKYILKLWCTKPSGELVEAVFPITITKRFGTMYITNKL